MSPNKKTWLSSSLIGLVLLLNLLIAHATYQSESLVSSYGTIVYPISTRLMGVNICPNDFWSSSKITANDFYRIRSWGMTHVALHLHWHYVEPYRDKPGVYDENFLKLVDKYVEWAKSSGLKVILGMSKANDPGGPDPSDSWVLWNEFFYDPAIRERFYDIWSMLALRYSKFDNVVAFEFCLDLSHKSAENNITELNKRQSIWHYTMVPKIIDRIRQVNKGVTLIYKPVPPETRYLRLSPIPDNNVLYAINFFIPYYATHELEPYNGDKELLRNCDVWQNWVNFGKRYNVSLYIAGWGMRIRGSDGVLYEPPSEDHLLWVHYVAQLAEEYNIHWSYWVFGYDRWSWDLLNSDGSQRTIVDVLKTYTG